MGTEEYYIALEFYSYIPLMSKGITKGTKPNRNLQ